MSNDEINQLILREVQRIGAAVDSLAQKMSSIELNTSTHFTAIDKDILALQREIEGIKKQQDLFTEADRQLYRRIESESVVRHNDFEKFKTEEYDKFKADQGLQNDKNKTLRAAIWTAIVVWVGILSTFIWELITKGGIQGLINP